MPVRPITPGLTPSNGYVCLACRLRAPYINRHSRRQQHTAIQPPNPSSDDPPPEFDRTSPKALDGKEDETSFPKEESKEKEPATFSLKLLKPSAEARQLQLRLHEKFVAQRRKDAASMQFAGILEGNSRARKPGAKTRKLGKADKQERRKAKHRSAEIIIETSSEPKVEEKNVPAIIAPSKPSPKAKHKATRIRKIKGGPSSSAGSIDEASKTEVEQTASVRDESDQAEGSKPSILQPAAKRLRLFKRVPGTDGPTDQHSATQPSSPTALGKPEETENILNRRIRRRPSTRSSSTARPRGKKVAKLNSITTSDVKADRKKEGDVAKHKAGLETVFRRIVIKQVENEPPVTTRTKSMQKNPRAPRAREREIINLHANQLSITALDLERPSVPRLSYGLERVLFNPGVYHLQDPRSRVYNFDPYLQTIMPVKEFDFNALKEYITSSRDTALQILAESHNKRYVGSSSSMTGVLAHFHFLLSQWRPINTKMLSRGFPDEHLTEFTELQRSPAAIFLKWRDGSYAIDADKEFAHANILMLLGKSMEKLLTLETEDFERYRKSSPHTVPEEERKAPEAYHYSTMGDFIMRSQLDAQDPRLPGTGMFDLKTRAVASVRMEASNYEAGSGYQIKSRQGAWESFEREYFDMIRSAFLKYSLQVRMGRMDGIFIAFHNTDRIFGFQYVGLGEMDSALHGQWDTNLGDQEFKLSVALLNDVLNKATQKYPNTVSPLALPSSFSADALQSLRLHFETRKAQTPFMYIFAEPVTEEQITAIQTAKNAKIQQFEDEIYGNTKAGPDDEGEDQSWENLEANVQNAMDDDIRDPNHEDGRQDLDPEIVEADDGDLKADPSANRHGYPDGTENEGAGTLAADEHSDDMLEHEEGADGEDPRATAMDETDDKADDEEVEVDEEQEDDKVSHGAEPQEQAEEAGASGGEEALNGIDRSTSYPEGARPLELAKEYSDDSESPPQTTEDAMAIAGDSVGGDETTNVNGQGPPSEDASPSGAEATSNNSTSGEQDSQPRQKEVLALTLTIRNKVDGRHVLRPVNLQPRHDWSIEYSLDPVPSAERAWNLYQACQVRRKKKLDDDQERRENEDQVNVYIQRLRQMSRSGAKWRKEQDERDKELPVRVLGQDTQPEKGGEA
ncbi:MAG: hypothetical protein L6R39_002578 [Caloplaca ligustica]|nr:MAG: hypothetical protein L6R39_002578 [Caloplaca ligustica]